MIITMLRTVGAVVAGVAVAFVMVVAVEMLSAVVHPFPADFKGTMEEVCRHVARYPRWFLAAAAAAWGATAFAGTWTAGRLGGRGPAAFVGLLLLAAALFNVSMLPYPIWFKAAAPVAILTAAAWGYRLSSRRARPAGNATG